MPFVNTQITKSHFFFYIFEKLRSEIEKDLLNAGDPYDSSSLRLTKRSERRRPVSQHQGNDTIVSSFKGRIQERQLEGN